MLVRFLSLTAVRYSAMTGPAMNESLDSDLSMVYSTHSVPGGLVDVADFAGHTPAADGTDHSPPTVNGLSIGP